LVFWCTCSTRAYSFLNFWVFCLRILLF
jgi:hypothetical protein